jgi:hypothetical protein
MGIALPEDRRAARRTGADLIHGRARCSEDFDGREGGVAPPSLFLR